MDRTDNLYVIEKNRCYGCMACYNVCPYGAIYINEDEEGFAFPRIDQRQCTHCGLCRKCCPSLRKDEKEYFCEQKGYIAQNTDHDMRILSTSGGVFGALADWFIWHDGIVFGAAVDDSLRIVHGFADNREDCIKFKGSKYVQSDIGKTYIDAKRFLEQKKYVLFSGTPCQIEGLHSFLGRPYDNLITVDVVCRGVLSPGLFRKYLEFQRQSVTSPITNIFFREKRWGYKYTALTMYSGNECIYASGTESDPLLRAFFEDDHNRMTCYHCRYRQRYRKSDITLWDCFNANLYDKKMDDDTGVNKVLTHTAKGEKLIEELGKRGLLSLKEVPVERLISENSEALHQDFLLDEEKRKKFFYDYGILSTEALWRKYYPNDIKVQLKRAGRRFLYMLGVYRTVRRIKNLMCVKQKRKI